MLINETTTPLTATCKYERHTADFQVELEENVGYLPVSISHRLAADSSSIPTSTMRLAR
jgi:hypothetical protein